MAGPVVDLDSEGVGGEGKMVESVRHMDSLGAIFKGPVRLVRREERVEYQVEELGRQDCEVIFGSGCKVDDGMSG